MPPYVNGKAIGRPKLSNEDRFPELYYPNRKIDRRKCVRVVPMRVLVLGMCRTGTACTFAFAGQSDKAIIDVEEY